MIRSMTAARHVVALLLAPELAALDAVAPAAAQAKAARMRKDPLSFARGATGLVAAWLARHHAGDGPWTWAVGDAHLGNIALLATGPRRADGRVPVTIDIADVDDEHAAPWSWDLLRLGASYAQAWPKLGGRAAAGLASAAVEAYADTLQRLADGDTLAGIVDLNGLPVPLQKALVDLNREAAPKRHLALHASTRQGRLRLRRGTAGAEDPEALEALRHAWDAQPDLPPHSWSDGVRRLTDHGVSSRGRRRWLVLIEEGRHHRLLEIKERPPSCLERVIGVTPFPPRDGRPITVPMGGDPYQRVLALASGRVLVRTRCHARVPLDTTTCDEGDRLRAAHLHGQLIARFQWTGLQRLSVEAARIGSDIATTAHQEAPRLGRHGVQLASHLTACWTAFRG